MLLNIFKGFRRGFVNSGNFKKYLLYSLGEIVLVVAGILIALTVNNWNDERKAKNHLKDVYKRVLMDTEHNINESDEIVDHFMIKEHLFLNVINDTVTPELAEADYGAYLITYFLHYDLEIEGYEQLKAINVDDTIAIEIIELYRSAILQFDLIEESIKNNAGKSLELWRDKYEWFADFISEKPNTEADEYFIDSPEFRNLVAYHHLLVFNNYIQNLRNFKRMFEELRDKMLEIEGMENVIEVQHTETFEISEEELKPFVGVYDIGNDFNVEINAGNGFLSIKPTGQPELNFYPTSSTNFYSKIADAKIEFKGLNGGSYDTLVLNSSGREIIGLRR